MVVSRPYDFSRLRSKMTSACAEQFLVKCTCLIHADITDSTSFPIAAPDPIDRAEKCATKRINLEGELEDSFRIMVRI